MSITSASPWWRWGWAACQVVLDKGQEDDWFGSRFITIFTVVSVISLVLCVIRELTTLTRSSICR